MTQIASRKVLTRQQVVNIKQQLLSKWPPSLDINLLIDVPVAYINLDISTDRYNYMERIFDTYHLLPRPVRVSAVWGKEYIKNPRAEPWISPELHLLLSKLVESGKTSPGELGCLLSHMKAILYGYRYNLSSLLILEDDVDFSCVGLWSSSLSGLIRRLRSDWNFVQLYYDCNGLITESELTRIDDGTRCYGTVAYLISARCMADLYNMLFDNFVLTTSMYYILQKKGLHFSSDVAVYNILSPKNVYIENIQRFAMNNYEVSLDSTIHTNHTSQHKAFTHRIWTKYLNATNMM
jgi:GR25 family glycosyltransferase involved in LPS biosynthesis